MKHTLKQKLNEAIMETRFFLFALKKNFKNASGLRANFAMNIFGMMLNNISFIFIWMYFAYAVGTIGGWTPVDIIALHGFASFCFGVTLSFLGGIYYTAEYVERGRFDTVLLAPKNILVRLSINKFDDSALGDVVYGVISLVIYAFLIKSGLVQVLMIFVLLFITTVILLSIAIIANTTTFYFANSKLLSKSIFETFFTPSLMYGGAFQGSVRFFFTFIVPSTTIAILPVEAVRSANLWTLFFLFIISLFWFTVAIKFFYKTIRRYESSNFFTFGG